MSQGSMADYLVHADWSELKHVVHNFLGDAIKIDTPLIPGQMPSSDRRNSIKSDLDRVSRAIKNSSRYRVDRQANDFVTYIADTLSDKVGSVQHIHMPCGLCFFELPWIAATRENDNAPGFVRQGVLFIGRLPGATPAWNDIDLTRALTEGMTTEGTVIIINQASMGSGVSMTAFYIDFKKGVSATGGMGDDGSIIEKPYTNVFMNVDKVTAEQLIASVGERGAALYMEHISYIVAALGCVLTSRGITEERTTDFARLNAKREKSGKPPLQTIRDVLIKLPKVIARSPVQPGAEPDPERRGKIKHMVMLFTRLKRGKIEVVSPHWRGDESLGIKLPSYFAKGK